MRKKSFTEPGSGGFSVELAQVRELLGQGELRLTADVYSHVQRQAVARQMARCSAGIRSCGQGGWSTGGGAVLP